jgi:cell division septation protein DedD
MQNDSRDRDLVIVDDGSVSGMARWVPAMVVLSVVSGFIGLSWYAYNAGSQSLKDDDLLVVEAEKTPMKEKPLDPGGMKFPNQDKTIFDTFSNGNKQTKVERILPQPEEPMKKDVDSSETGTWINDKLQKTDVDTAEVAELKPDAIVKKVEALKQKASGDDSHIVIPAQPDKGIDDSQTFVAKKTPLKVEEPAPTEVKKEEPKKEVAKVEKAQPASGGNVSVQLGAFRSEEELNAAWNKMKLKHKVLSDKKPITIKADLGDKGIYYRLRVGGLSGAAEAKALCGVLTDKGQACILPVGK